MPPKYRRLIIGLLVFLGLMLLIGRFRIDTTHELPLPRDTASRAEARALTARKASIAAERNPYAAATCLEAAPAALASLRNSRDSLVSQVGFSNPTDPYSLSTMIDIEDSLRQQSLPDCLDRARNSLVTAADRAEQTLSLYLDSGLDAFTLHARMQEAMQPDLEKAEQEFSQVENALQAATTTTP